MTRSYDAEDQPDTVLKVPVPVSVLALHNVAGSGALMLMNACAASHQGVSGACAVRVGTRLTIVRLLVRSGFQQTFGRTVMRTAEQYGLDDSAVQAMGRAFDIACARLSRTGIMLPRNLERLQKIAAQQLVIYARNGERNEWRLARRAIFAVCAAVAADKLIAGMSGRPELVVE